MALTAKKKAFGDAVFSGKANKDAAIAAGYSAKTASAAGSRLVKDEDVILYMTALRAKASNASGDPDLDGDFLNLPARDDPKDFLLDVMNTTEIELRIRVDSAKALMPFIHTKKGEGGKKDATAHAAKQAASKFTATAAPHLKVAK